MSEARRALEQQGYCSLPPLERSLTVPLIEALQRWRAQTTPPSNNYGILANNIWQQLPEFHDALFNTPLGTYAAQLLGEDAFLFQDNLIWKTPSTERIPWHQDIHYWPLVVPQALVMWVALDDTTIDNGCIHYIGGTHTLGERQPTNFADPSAESDRPDLPPLRWQEHSHRACPITLPAGGIVAHHPCVWHMSPPNQTAGHRRAWSLTWITAAARWDTQRAPHPFNYFLQPVDGTPPRGELFPCFTAPIPPI